MSDESGVLRRAASLLRDRGLHAAPGPWEESSNAGNEGPRSFQVGQVGGTPFAFLPPHSSSREPATAEWIAMANPEIADDLAALLDAAADGSLTGSATTHAVNVASALVRYDDS